VCASQWIPPAAWERVGVDILPGPGVDVVADIHELSRHFPPRSADGVYSVVVWEHLLMPWKAVLELNHVLKPGGIAWIVTHQDYPIHEAPWDFYRFGPDAWPVLFGPATGFEILEAGRHSPIEVRPENRSRPAFSSYGATQVLVRKVAELDPEKARWDVDLREALPTGHFYAKGPTLREKIAFKLRPHFPGVADRLAGIGESQPVSPDDPWNIASGARRGEWLFVRGPRPRPLGGAVTEISMTPERLDHRHALGALRGRTFDGIALLDVLHHDPQPWTLPSLLEPLLRPGGLVYVDTAQAVPPGEGPRYWGLSAEALFGLFHPAGGFEMVRHAMRDPCAMLGDGMEGAGPARGWLRVLGLARKSEAPAADSSRRFTWPAPTS
jgi:Methyltransferase domain